MSNVLDTIGKSNHAWKNRDAIHVAIIPIFVMEAMAPGTPVQKRYSFDSDVTPCAADHKDCIGVIDPFLKEDAQPYATVWLFLHPNSVQALRHSWTHDKFEDEGEQDWDDYDDGCRGC
jgi:hypothetical protein